jgi:hypothetical protein
MSYNSILLTSNPSIEIFQTDYMPQGFISDTHDEKYSWK